MGRLTNHEVFTGDPSASFLKILKVPALDPLEYQRLSELLDREHYPGEVPQGRYTGSPNGDSLRPDQRLPAPQHRLPPQARPLKKPVVEDAQSQYLAHPHNDDVSSAYRKALNTDTHKRGLPLKPEEPEQASPRRAPNGGGQPSRIATQTGHHFTSLAEPSAAPLRQAAKKTELLSDIIRNDCPTSSESTEGSVRTNRSANNARSNGNAWKWCNRLRSASNTCNTR